MQFYTTYALQARSTEIHGKGSFVQGNGELLRSRPHFHRKEFLREPTVKKHGLSVFHLSRASAKLGRDFGRKQVDIFYQLRLRL